MESKKTKAGKDGKPKGRMSAYTFFVQTCREEHRKKHPNENVNFTEFSKKCAERWKVTYIEFNRPKIFTFFNYLKIKANDR